MKREAKIQFIVANSNLTVEFFDDLTTREVTALYKLVLDRLALDKEQTS